MVLYKQIMNVFIRANSAIASLHRTFHLSQNENIPTIALINIHYLYNIQRNENDLSGKQNLFS